MMCCAVATLFVAAIAALRGAAKKAWARLPRARWAAALLAAALVLVGGSALMARQLGRAPQQIDFPAFLMQHICGTHPAPQHHNP